MIMLDVGRSRDELTDAIYATLRANDMIDGVHVRLMVTRGLKRTPYQDPRVTLGPATVVIIAEHKQPLSTTVTDGITLFTTHVRRAAPDTLDPKLNTHSKLNDITACIQAYTAGAVLPRGNPRANVLEICRSHGISARETRFSLTDVYSAREAS